MEHPLRVFEADIATEHPHIAVRPAAMGNRAESDRSLQRDTSSVRNGLNLALGASPTGALSEGQDSG